MSESAKDKRDRGYEFVPKRKRFVMILWHSGVIIEKLKRKMCFLKLTGHSF